MSDQPRPGRRLTTALTVLLFIGAMAILSWRIWARQQALTIKEQIEGPPPVTLTEDEIRKPNRDIPKAP